MKKIIKSKKTYEPNFSEKWPSLGTGRYVKRQLSKARRRFAKHIIKFGRYKSPSDWESTANWKTW